eukprot:9061866-Alexandrium_andersonii.AAC.1
MSGPGNLDDGGPPRLDARQQAEHVTELDAHEAGGGQELLAMELLLVGELLRAGAEGDAGLEELAIEGDRRGVAVHDNRAPVDVGHVQIDHLERAWEEWVEPLQLRF